jgi:hypothetical protein
VFDKFGVDHPVNLIYVTLVQRDKDRLLVRKVLVDRANAYARNFGNPVCCDSSKALTSTLLQLHRVRHRPSAARAAASVGADVTFS